MTVVIKEFELKKECEEVRFMNISRFENLPDYIETDELETYFTEVISNKDSYSSLELAEALYELADRQWRTYELLNEDIRRKVDRLVFDLWDPNSFELVDCILSVIAILGLIESYQLIKSELNKSINNKVKNEIQELIKEIGENIEKPYSGME